ncbi:MAG: hypothetical protein DDT37_01982 [Firmicutes bacterium]|nr:hypothetical protein [candidate division NPL-UPA2 bacterium]
MIDTLDWLEKLIWQATCLDKDKDCIEDFGYGKGYVMVLRRWEKLLTMLDGCREHGMNTILLAHARVERFTPPDGDAYDRWQPDLHKLASALVQEWADEVLFARVPVYTSTEKREGQRQRVRAIGQGDRVVHTIEASTHAAKRRIQLPDQIPLDWSEYQKYWPVGDINGIVIDGHSKKKEQKA